MNLRIDKIDAAMDARGWNNFKLSLASDTPEMTIYGLRKGKRIPRAATLARICQALGLTIHELLADEAAITFSDYARRFDANDLKEDEWKRIETLFFDGALALLDAELEQLEHRRTLLGWKEHYARELNIVCSKCKAPVGEMCRWGGTERTGQFTDSPHTPRRRAAGTEFVDL